MIKTPLPLTTPEVQGYIEEAYWPAAGPTAVLIRGWIILNQDLPWLQLSARVNGRTVGRANPQPRPDVEAAFPLHSSVRLSGFELHLPPVELSEYMDLVVEPKSDSAPLKLITIPVHQIPGKSASFPFYPKWRLNLKMRTPKVSQGATPSFSIVLPIFNPPPEVLEACLRSISEQQLTDWEAILIDDASSTPETGVIIEKWVNADNRFRLVRNPFNQGIGRSTNIGIERASREWVVFVDHDDQLLPHALTHIAHAIATTPEVQLVYTDEEKISATDTPFSPFFKPDWSPHFLRGVMYVGHLLTVKKNTLNAVGGIDPDFDGIQDYELTLRISELSPRVAHLAVPLYQWRMVEQSSALSGNVKGDMDRLQVEAVRRHLQRMGHPGIPCEHGGHRVLVDPPPEFHPPPHSVVTLTDTNWRKEIESAPATSYFFVKHTDLADVDDESIRRLIFHATTDANLIAAPLMLTADHVVAESGCTLSSSSNWNRIMAGFDPLSDGYNGSLSTHREVSTTSGDCFVISSTGWNKLKCVINAAVSLADAIYVSGLKVMVVANARATSLLTFRQILDRIIPSQLSDFKDPFWNPHFDPNFADYRLIESPAQSSSFQYDLPLPDRTRDGRMHIIGWCIPPDQGQISGARVKVADWIVDAQTGIDRPDVSHLLTGGIVVKPGFEVRFELPPGRHEIQFEVQPSPGSEWVHLESRSVLIERPTLSVAERLTDPDKFVAFQLGIHAKHPPRKIRFPVLDTAKNAVLPALSLVTPSFNQAKFLPQTLESVTQNKLQGIEHIVMDGNSTDGSQDWLRAHPAAHRIWHSAPDHGQADAVQKGFALSEGTETDLMAWINSDDFFVPQALDFVREYFAEHPEVDALYGNRILVDEAGAEINRWSLPPHDPTVLELNDYVPQETLFWRRRVWQKVGGIDSNFQFALDWDFLLRVQAAGFNMVHVPQFLACFRIHAAQKTSAQMTTWGQREIDQLRRRTFGRDYPSGELLKSPALLAYLQEAALLEVE